VALAEQIRRDVEARARARAIVELSEQCRWHREQALSWERAPQAARDDEAARCIARAAEHREQAEVFTAELTFLRRRPPACPQCGAPVGWEPQACSTCHLVASQSPPPILLVR